MNEQFVIIGKAAQLLEMSMGRLIPERMVTKHGRLTALAAAQHWTAVAALTSAASGLNEGRHGLREHQAGVVVVDDRDDTPLGLAQNPSARLANCQTAFAP